LYVPGDTAFNESFASTVEIAGIRQWLNSVGKSDDIDIYLQQLKRRSDFVEAILALRSKLSSLYASPLDQASMREEKQRIIKDFQQVQYPELKTKWQGYSGYDRWILGQRSSGNSPETSVINNAKLSTIASYHQWVPAFETLLKQNNNDFPAFYRAAKELAALEFTPRQQALEQLLK